MSWAKAAHNRILIGLLVGIIAGITANEVLGRSNTAVVWILSNITEPVGTLFLRLLLMTVLPLVFSSLIIGLSGIGDIKALGRVGVRCFVYCLVISAISVGIGLTISILIYP